jgi:polyisoprenoid-binding protein YceI
LTIKNVTKEISFQLSQTQDKAKVYIGTTEINRFDFGVNYDSMINKISEKVLIHFKITKD